MMRTVAHASMGMFGLLALTGGQLAAVETELQLGPDMSRGNTELRDSYLHEGAVLSDDVAWTGTGEVRFSNVGIEITGVLAIGDDDRRDVDSLDLLEVEFRLDYLLEIEDFGHVIPHYQTSFFPYRDDVDEPHWLGVDAWYLVPYEGLEAGASIDVDAGGEWGWFTELGLRQFVQYADSSLDLRFWQVIGYGDSDFHRYTTGVDESGFTTLELGGLATVSLPWDNTWASVRLEAHWWLESDDRDALEDTMELVLGIGLDFRPDWW